MADYGFSVAQVEVPPAWVIAGNHGVAAYAWRHAVKLRRAPLARVLRALDEDAMARVLNVRSEIDLERFSDVYGEDVS